jgi:hypothetical protein
MRSRRSSSVPALTRQSIGLAIAVPEVVGHRVMRMCLAGPSPSRRDRVEFQRMWKEKSDAFYESWNAMFLEMFRSNLALAMLPMKAFGWTATPARLSAHHRQTAARVLAAGLGPVHRRATANAKRLRRTG